MKNTDADGIIWVKEVEDYQRFGVVVTDDGRQHDEDRREADRRRSRSARTSACTTSRTGSCCTRGSTTSLKQPKNKGEYYLTDAFQYMIDKGAKIKVDRRRRLVRRGQAGHAARDEPHDAREAARARRPANVPTSVTIIDPVYIEDDVTLANSTIGPNVSIGAGSSDRGLDAHATRSSASSAKLKGAQLHELADRRRRDGRRGEGRGDGRRPLGGARRRLTRRRASRAPASPAAPTIVQRAREAELRRRCSRTTRPAVCALAAAAAGADGDGGDAEADRHVRVGGCGASSGSRPISASRSLAMRHERMALGSVSPHGRSPITSTSSVSGGGARRAPRVLLARRALCTAARISRLDRGEHVARSWSAGRPRATPPRGSRSR